MQVWILVYMIWYHYVIAMPTHIYSSNIKVGQVIAFQKAYPNKQKYSNSIRSNLTQIKLQINLGFTLWVYSGFTRADTK